MKYDNVWTQLRRNSRNSYKIEESQRIEQQLQTIESTNGFYWDHSRHSIELNVFRVEMWVNHEMWDVNTRASDAKLYNNRNDFGTCFSTNFIHLLKVRRLLSSIVIDCNIIDDELRHILSRSANLRADCTKFELKCSMNPTIEMCTHMWRYQMFLLAIVNFRILPYFHNEIRTAFLSNVCNWLIVLECS